MVGTAWLLIMTTVQVCDLVWVQECRSVCAGVCRSVQECVHVCVHVHVCVLMYMIQTLSCDIHMYVVTLMTTNDH